MSQAANGIISGEGITFDSTFTIDGREYVFSGGFNGVSVPKFVSSNAVLTYSKQEDLFGPMQFQGNLGVKAIGMNMDRGIMIAAPLDKDLDRAYTIIGSGSWHFSVPTPTAPPQAAKGAIYCGEAGFDSTFTIDGHEYVFSGRFNGVAVDKFTSTDAVLTYLKKEDLVGSMQFQGDVGVKTIVMNMEKGITFAVPLYPGQDLDKSYTITGNGDWH